MSTLNNVIQTLQTWQPACNCVVEHHTTEARPRAHQISPGAIMFVDLRHVVSSHDCCQSLRQSTLVLNVQRRRPLSIANDSISDQRSRTMSQNALHTAQKNPPRRPSPRRKYGQLRAPPWAAETSISQYCANQWHPAMAFETASLMRASLNHAGTHWVQERVPDVTPPHHPWFKSNRQVLFSPKPPIY